MEIKGTELVKLIFEKIFTSDIINAIVNIILPCIISVHCTNYEATIDWWSITIIIFAVIIVFNVVSTIMKHIKNRQNKQLSIIHKCYREQCSINSKFANNIFRLNKAVNESIKNNKPISKKSLDKIADFQTFSFSICESVHSMLKQEFGEDILCEVTLMKKEDNKIKMVAYANNDNQMPSSYKTEFELDKSEICFVRLFNDLNGKIVCLPDKEKVTSSFLKLEGSIKRENEICQYVGIPIKTNRNEIELLLQIDVSKPKILGKNEDEMKSFAKNIIYPYAMLLHKSYERDLVFNQYYDMIDAVLSKKQE